MNPTLRNLAEALATGRTTSRALVEACLERIDDRSGEGGRTFIKVHREAARVAADAMDRLRGAGLAPSPFAGIPISVKDLFDLAGETTTAGSKVLIGAEPAQHDAPAIARLRAAGFVVIGRANMTEFAFSGLGLNPHYGTPLNSYDRATGRIPGGSSSGSAVSVTDGMAHGTIGTDTGGSCRIPAALTGLVGFKPTARRVPLEGAIPLSWSLDSVGPLGRSVGCCAALDAIMANEDPRLFSPREAVAGLRLAVPQTLVLEGLDEAVAAAFSVALTRLSGAGAVIADLPLEEFGRIPDINKKGGFPTAEAYAWHRRLIAEKGDGYDPRVLKRILRGKEQSAADYLDLCRARADLIPQITERTADFDALVLPTVPIIAPTLRDVEGEEAYVRTNLLVLRNPLIANLLDGCSISLPIHRPGDAPVGLMLVGRTGEDHRILSIAAGIERTLAAAPAIRPGSRHN
jgi:aspartyl-tRNA(Asn)/glutamyl-tRNA(Gln) amidotransferase subunit A